MLHRNSTSLVIVDVQGRLAGLMHDREMFWANLQRLIKSARVLGLPILWNEQLPEKLGPTIEPIRQLLCDSQPMPKTSFSCCGNPAFIAALERTGRQQVLLTGLETHICVYQTARDLLARGYEVHVASDAVASRFADNKQVGLDRMKDAGAVLSSTEMALFEMMVKAEGPEFFEIVKFLK